MSPAPRSAGRWAQSLALVLVLAGLGLVAAALVTRHHGRSAAGPPRTLPVDKGGRHALAGFTQTRATVTLPHGQQLAWCLMVAAAEAQQHQGLSGVTNAALGGFDGMVFPFSHPTDTEFWMKDTPLPLSVAFFDAGGHFVSSTDMAPCGDSSSCPNYSAARNYTLAVEVPQGRFAGLGIGVGSTLRLEPGACHVTAEAAPPVTTDPGPATTRS